jgi:hypothetical protein
MLSREAAKAEVASWAAIRRQAPRVVLRICGRSASDHSAWRPIMKAS